MRNLEQSGIVGSVEIAADKKTGLPVQKISLMDESGKMVKVTAEKVNDEIQALKHGLSVFVRCENVKGIMAEYGNLTFRCESLSLVKGAAVAKVVNQ